MTKKILYKIRNQNSIIKDSKISIQIKITIINIRDKSLIDYDNYESQIFRFR